MNQYRNCFGAAGHGAEDPQRLGHPADHRELAGRDGGLDGRSAARSVRPLGPPDQRGRRRRRRARLPEDAGGAAPGDHATARRCPTSCRSPTACASRRSPSTRPRARWSRDCSPPRRRSGSRSWSPPATPARPRARAACPPASSPRPTRRPRCPGPPARAWVLAVGGTNLTLNPNNAIAATGPWNDTAYPAPYTTAAGRRRRAEHASRAGRGGSPPSRSRTRATGWCPTSPLFADESPGYPIVCSSGVKGCPKSCARASRSSAARAPPRRSWPG